MLEKLKKGNKELHGTIKGKIENYQNEVKLFNNKE